MLHRLDTCWTAGVYRCLTCRSKPFRRYCSLSLCISSGLQRPNIEQHIHTGVQDQLSLGRVLLGCHCTDPTSSRCALLCRVFLHKPADKHVRHLRRNLDLCKTSRRGYYTQPNHIKKKRHMHSLDRADESSARVQRRRQPSVGSDGVEAWFFCVLELRAAAQLSEGFRYAYQHVLHVVVIKFHIRTPK